MRTRRLGVIAVAVASLTAAACSSSNNGTSAAGGTSLCAPGSVSATAYPNFKGRTLTLWDYESDTSAMGVAWNAAIKEFEQKTGATVKFQAKTFEQIQQNGSMILNSSSAPDILEYNKGNATAGQISKEGLLTDLTACAHAYGWDKTLSPGIATTAQYNTAGIMGSGKWYGVPDYGEYVMVYYNKDMFAKYGLTVPTTYAQFTADLDTFRQHGITPIASAGNDYPDLHLWYELLLHNADRSFINDYELYDAPVDFTGPQMTAAAQTFADWVSKGYIAKSASGLQGADMGNAFTGQKSPIMISGSWWYGTFETQIKNFQWGTFLFPGNTLDTGSSGNIWVVPAKSKNADMAAEFINVTLQPDIQNLMGNSGGVPVAASPNAITDPMNRQLISNFNTLEARNGIAYYPDWPGGPSYYNTLVSDVQNLLLGTDTPAAFNAAIGQSYQGYVTSIGQK